MKLGSMFTGYGGLDMAANKILGSVTAWHCEIEPAAIKLLELRYPNIPNLGDVTAIDWSTVEPVEVLAAGFPCQPISYAGKGLMQDDPRWLWPHVAKAIRVLRPRIILLENVSAITNRGLGDVLADLASLGFNAEWDCVRASDIGAPHQRARFFLCAWLADAQGERLQGAAATGAAGRNGHDLYAHQETASHAFSERIDGGGCRGSGGKNLRTAIGELVQAAENADSEPWGERGQSAAGEAQSGWSRSDIGGRNRVAAFDWAGTGYEETIAHWERIFGPVAPSPVDAKMRLAPAFTEWMMGVPGGHITGAAGLSRSAQLKMIGNGVVPQQAEYAYRLLMGRLV